MSDFQKDLETIKNPENIKEAVYASGPGNLMKVFEKDPTVQRLIRGGAKVAPLVSAEIKKNGQKLPKITLACLAYVLQKTDRTEASTILRPFFIRAMNKPDPYFIFFGAHAIREDLKLPLRPDAEYSYNELQETKTWVERLKRTREGG